MFLADIITGTISGKRRSTLGLFDENGEKACHLCFRVGNPARGSIRTQTTGTVVSAAGVSQGPQDSWGTEKLPNIFALGLR